MAAVTRLGLYGGTRSPYGSFAGKVEGEVVLARTKGGSAKEQFKRKKKQLQPQIPQEVFELKAIGEIDPDTGDLVLYTDIPQLQQEVDLISKAAAETAVDVQAINDNLNFLRVIRRKEEGRKVRLVIVNTLDMFLEEEAVLLLLLANNQ